MADGIYKDVGVRFDRESGRQLQKELVASIEGAMRKAGEEGSDAFERESRAGGQQAGRALVRALESEVERTMAKARILHGKRLINEKQFKEIEREAHRAFNDKLIPALERLRAESRLSEAELVDLSRSIRRVGDEGDDAGDKASSGIGRIAGAIKAISVAVAGSVVFGFLKNLTTELYEIAAAAGETQSKFETVFQSATARAEQFVRDFANLAGLTRTELRETMGSVGGIAVSMGMGEEAAAGFSERVVRLAADMASFNNASPVETLQAIQAAFRGEYDPLERFLVQLTAADVQMRALTDTGKAHVDQLTKEDKALAALNLMYAQAKVQVGDLDRTSNSLANRKRRLIALTGEWKEMLALRLLPTFTEYTEKIGAWMDANEAEADRMIRDFAEVLRLLLEITALAGRVVVVTVQVVTTGLDWAKAPERWIEGLDTGIRRRLGRNPLPVDDNWLKSDAIALGITDEEFARRFGRDRVAARAALLRMSEDEYRRRYLGEDAFRLPTARATPPANRVQSEGGEGGGGTDAKVLTEELDQLAKLKKMRELTAADARRAAEIERELAAAIKEGSLKLGERVAALDAIHDFHAKPRGTGTRRDPLEQEIRMLGELQQHRALSMAESLRAAEIEAQLTGALGRKNNSLKTEVELRERLARVRAVRRMDRAQEEHAPDETAPVITGETRLTAGTNRPRLYEGPQIDVQGGRTRARRMVDASTAEDLDRQAQALARIAEQRSLTVEEAGRALALEEQIERRLAEQNLTYEERIALLHDLAELRELNFADLSFDNFFEAIVDASASAGEAVAGHWSDAFEVVLEEGFTAKRLLDGLWDGYRKGVFLAIASEAKARAGKALVEALEQGAHAVGALASGNLPKAAAHGKAALKWTAVGAAWSALAGGSAAVGNNDGGKDGGGVSASSETGREASDRAPARKIEVHNYWDPLTHNDPRARAFVKLAMDEANKEYGEDEGVAIYTHPYPRGY